MQFQASVLLPVFSKLPNKINKAENTGISAKERRKKINYASVSSIPNVCMGILYFM